MHSEAIEHHELLILRRAASQARLRNTKEFYGAWQYQPQSLNQNLESERWNHLLKMSA